MELSTRELETVVGGGIGKWIIFGGLFTFIVGVIDGYLRPLRKK